MRNLPAASDFTLSTDSSPFWPSLYSVTVAPGCGLPVVRLVTVPSTAAEAMEASRKSSPIPAKPLHDCRGSDCFAVGHEYLRMAHETNRAATVMERFMPEPPASAYRTLRKI